VGIAHRVFREEARGRARGVKSIAVIASRGSFNSLVQVATLLMAAVGSEMAVRVFFRDEAVLKLTKSRAREMNLSEIYRGMEAGVTERLKAQELDDLPRLFTDARRAGDVRLYACSSSMAICGVKAEELLEGIEVRGLTAFLLEDIAAADRVLTF
jgi:peroxiredoxin family protein